MRAAEAPGARTATVSSKGTHDVALSGPRATIPSCATSSRPITDPSPVLAAGWRLLTALLLLLALHVPLLALGAAEELLGLPLGERRLRLGLLLRRRGRRVRLATATAAAAALLLFPQRELVVPLCVGI